MTHYNARYFNISTPAKNILLLEISRPPVNAFSEEAWEELQSIFEQISVDGDIRAVVLASSNPKIFTAGIDVGDLQRHSESPFPDQSRKALGLQRHILRFQNAISSIEKCTQPVIAAINGVALGLAIDIASAADIRYASSDARFSIKEVDVGLAADIGTLARFPKITGNESLARELALTARMFDAKEASQIGFLSKVVDGGREEVIKAAVETASLIAQKSPLAVVGTKHLMLHSRDHSVQENLEYTATWNGAMLLGPDSQLSMQATKFKKPANFPPLTKLSGKL